MLQVPNLSRQGRLRDVEALGGSSEVLLLSYADEIAQMPKLHLIPHRYWINRNKVFDVSIMIMAHSRRR